MDLDEIQPFLVSQIKGEAQLAAFGEPLTRDPLIDDAITLADANVHFASTGVLPAGREVIADRMRTKGVCLEVGLFDLEQAENSSGGATDAAAVVEVYAAESPTVVHTPSGHALVKLIRRAICRRNEDTQFGLLGYESGKHEHGYILHCFLFGGRVLLND